MSRTSLLAAVAVAALTLGVTDKASLRDTAPLSTSDIVIAADDTTPSGATSEENADESAKMGEEEGTHAGAPSGETPEADTKKVDQPARQDPATGDEHKGEQK